jgi:hypothetical protein
MVYPSCRLPLEHHRGIVFLGDWLSLIPIITAVDRRTLVTIDLTGREDCCAGSKAECALPVNRVTACWSRLPGDISWVSFIAADLVSDDLPLGGFDLAWCLVLEIIAEKISTSPRANS